ncbi:FliM/FliN family flagellar motor switch protein [Roseovarius sp. 2305UL8-3]|uniref:FliM/FliN family flagellar motor switch protein n=1 Tax=Roseovarius conchicola TaxID=3121636 RepID=UPI0035298826
MALTDTSSIIHRKARVGREGFDARAMSPSKALRLSLAKSAETLFELALSVTTVEQVTIGANAIPDKLGDDGLLMLLDGAGGQRGAVKLDTQFIAALIEAQITGEVRATAAQPRTYTRTDAAMAAPFLDAVLDGFDAQLRETDEAYLPKALRFGDKVDDARVLGLALEGGRYDLYSITVDLAEGAKTGVISVLVPQITAPKGPKPGQDNADKAGTDTLAQNALEATATLDAVMARIEMPLKDIWGLKVGMALPIAAKSIDNTQLIAPGSHFVAEVRLGQLNGLRAVRLVSDHDGGEDQANRQITPEPAAIESTFEYDLDMLPAQADVAGDPVKPDPGAKPPPETLPQPADG